MPPFFRRRLIFALLLFCTTSAFSLLFYSCTPAQNTPKKPLILVSAPPYVTVVQQIADGEFDVLPVVPSDADPHTWEPKPSEVAPFTEAKIWFTIGEAFESVTAKKLLEVSPSMKIIDLASVVKNPIEDPHHHHGHDHRHGHGSSYDTHFWLDPIVISEQAELIAKSLEELSPESAALFAFNLAKFQVQMKALNRETEHALKDFQGYALVTTHSAFTYYCRQYGLEQIVIEPGIAKEPGGKDVTRILQKIDALEGKVAGVIIQPQHLNVAAERIAEAKKLPVFTINPYVADFPKTITELTAIVTAHKE